VRDLRVFADVVDRTVQHYRDSDDLEIDAVVTAGDGRWATGYGYTRPDGVVVIPAATLGP
jgi:hypothetical protein